MRAVHVSSSNIDEEILADPTEATRSPILTTPLPFGQVATPAFLVSVSVSTGNIDDGIPAPVRIIAQPPTAAQKATSKLDLIWS